MTDHSNQSDQQSKKSQGLWRSTFFVTDFTQWQKSPPTNLSPTSRPTISIYPPVAGGYRAGVTECLPGMCVCGLTKLKIIKSNNFANFSLTKHTKVHYDMKTASLPLVKFVNTISIRFVHTFFLTNMTKDDF